MEMITNIIQILTGAEVNTDKLCPSVVQHCTTEGHNFSVLIEANSFYFGARLHFP